MVGDGNVGEKLGSRDASELSGRRRRLRCGGRTNMEEEGDALSLPLGFPDPNILVITVLHNR